MPRHPHEPHPLLTPTTWLDLTGSPKPWMHTWRIRIEATRPELLLLLRVGLLLVTFLFVDHFLNRAGDLPPESLAAAYLIPGLVTRVGIAVAMAMVLLAAALARYGHLLDGWDALETGGALRGFVLMLVVLLAWSFSTYGFNYFLDHGHVLERALVLLLVPLIWLRPVFVFPFLMLAFTMMWQLDEPPISSGAIFPLKLQLLRILNLFAATFLIHSVTGHRRTDTFWFLACCLVASAYWVPGAAKLAMGWLTYGHLSHMPLAAYAHGWLGFAEPERVVAFARILEWLDWPMRLFVLIVEVGALCFMWRRSWSCLILIGATLFHIGTFALYGYLFWTWMPLDLALLFLLIRDRHLRRIPIYSRTHFALSVVLLLFASYWARPATLAWFDTGLSVVYRYDVRGVSGQEYRLLPEFFAPYGDVITMANFGYLADEHRQLVGPYGITGDRDRADRLLAARTPAEVFALEAAIGSDRYDATRAQQFYGFLTRYLTNWNARHGQAVGARWVGPPAHFWSFPAATDNVFEGQEAIREILVKEVTTFYDGQQLRNIRELELERIVLADPHE